MAEEEGVYIEDSITSTESTGVYVGGNIDVYNEGNNENGVGV